jgi:VWFA-related protein
MRWRLIAATIIFLLTTAQSREPQSQTTPTFSISVNLIKVPISIFDESGSPVQKPLREDLRLYEDGHLQQIRSFGVDINPTSVVLLLDTSATVKKELKKIKEAAENFASELSDDDRISIIAFSDEPDLLLDWTDDTKQVGKALRKIDQGLRTALYDAMLMGARDQLRGIDGRKALILLTDCLNNQSVASFQEASNAILQSQASLYVVSKTVMVRQAAYKQRRVVMLAGIYKRLFGDDNYIEEFFKKRETEMTELAESTGGRCYFPSDYDRIKGVYAEVAKELKNQLYLTYISNQTMSPGSYHRISIEYLAPSSKLIYRKGYYYSPAPSTTRIR